MEINWNLYRPCANHASHHDSDENRFFMVVIFMGMSIQSLSFQTFHTLVQLLRPRP